MDGMHIFRRAQMFDNQFLELIGFVKSWILDLLSLVMSK